jgi:hypothetical protein
MSTKTLAIGIFSFGLLFWTGQAVASTYPLENILSKDDASKLEKAGIKTSDELLEKGATPATRIKLAKDTSTDVKVLTEWVRMCDLLRVKGIGPIMVKLLGAVKVTSVAQLRIRNPKKLSEEIEKVNAKEKITEKTPSEKHLENWIDQAKKLKIVLR